MATTPSRSTPSINPSNPATAGAENEGPGCLTLSLFLLGIVAIVGVAIYLLILFSGTPIRG